MNAEHVEELLAKSRAGRPSVLDGFKAYLHQRWNDGCTNASSLHREILAHGYRGSFGTLADYLAPFRELDAAPSPRPMVPKVRKIASWILRRPDDLDTDEQIKLKQALTACPHLDMTASHVAAFAQMLTSPQPQQRRQRQQQLDDWMTTVEADDLPHLHRFITGLHRDYDAVLNGLTTPHSSGAVEGNVNRIKVIKRQMYGRAKFDLLRKRVLLS